jgi:hypothetical protein
MVWYDGTQHESTHSPASPPPPKKKTSVGRTCEIGVCITLAQSPPCGVRSTFSAVRDLHFNQTTFSTLANTPRMELFQNDNLPFLVFAGRRKVRFLPCRKRAVRVVSTTLTAAYSRVEQKTTVNPNLPPSLRHPRAARCPNSNNKKGAKQKLCDRNS